MTMSKRLYFVAALVAVLAIAFSAVTLTSRLTSASDPTVAVESCDQQDEADDVAEAASEEVDTDDVEEECGPQDEDEDTGVADTDDVQDEIGDSGGLED